MINFFSIISLIDFRKTKKLLFILGYIHLRNRRALLLLRRCSVVAAALLAFLKHPLAAFKIACPLLLLQRSLCFRNSFAHLLFFLLYSFSFVQKLLLYFRDYSFIRALILRSISLLPSALCKP